jgi:hypothetical protein
MTKTEQFAVLAALDTRLTAIMETRVKLRDRRNSVILSSEEDFEIETALLRLDQIASDIIKYKNALVACDDDLQQPSPEAFERMRARVAEISQINVANATTSAIMVTSTEVLGEIAKATSKPPDRSPRSPGAGGRG